MILLIILGATALFIAFLTTTGAQPEGGRPASSTRLMTAARAILVLVGVTLLAAAIFQALG